MVNGRIYDVACWYPGLDDWASVITTPPQVPLGTDYHLANAWVNEGTERAKGRIDAVITKPGGQKVTLEGVVGQDVDVDPGGYGGVTFASLVLDQAGNYQGEFVLKMEGAVEPSPDGEYYDHYLGAGDNNIGYLGRTLPCAECFASIVDYLVIVWYYDAATGTWSSWVPVWAGDLLTIEYGKAYWVEVTQDCIWRYPLP